MNLGIVWVDERRTWLDGLQLVVTVSFSSLCMYADCGREFHIFCSIG